MKRLLLACAIALFLGGCATTAPAPAVLVKPSTAQGRGGADAPSEAFRAAEHEVAAALRAIEARVRRSESAQMRQALTERIARQPGDLLAKLYLAWIDAPSESAGTQINALAKMNPEEPWLRTALARIYLQWKGFVPQARAEIAQVLDRYPDFVPALAVRAEIERIAGNLDAAAAGYRAVVARDPLCFEAQLGLARALEDLGDLKGARAALDAAIAIDGSDPALLRKMAEILAIEGEMSAVLTIYEKLLASHPDDAEIRRKLGDLRLSQGDLEGAAAAFERLQEAEPAAEVARRLAEIYVALSRPQDEQRALEELVRLDASASADVYRRLFELRQEDGDAEGAEAALRQAIARAPEELALRILLAQSLGERGALIPAILAHREAIALGAGDLRAELRALEARAGLPPAPLRGNVARLYNLVHLHLKKALARRHASQPWLGGTLGLRAAIGPEGKVSEVQITKNSLQDPELTALVYFSILDAQLPGERPRGVSFEFVLLPAEGSQR